MTELKLTENHLTRRAPVRGKRAEPREQRLLQAIARRQVRDLGQCRSHQHGVIRPVEPRIDNVFLFAKTRVHVGQSDSQSPRHLVESHVLPRGFLGQSECGIYNAILQ